MSSSTLVMAPRWSAQPAPPPATDRVLLTPAARALLRASALSLEDLDAAPGAVIRLAQVVAAQQDKGAPRAPDSSPGESTPTAAVGLGCVVVDAVLEGTDALETRFGRLVRAAAAVLRPTETGAPSSASVLVLGLGAEDPASDPVVIDDVGSLEVAALAQRIAERRSAATSVPTPRLAVLDATRLDVRRLEPATLADVTVAVASPAARLVPLRTADGTQVVAVRDVSEITVRHHHTVTPVLAARVATASAAAFSTSSGGTP